MLREVHGLLYEALSFDLSLLQDIHAPHHVLVSRVSVVRFGIDVVSRFGLLVLCDVFGANT
jgi:hypothetical protein